MRYQLGAGFTSHRFKSIVENAYRRTSTSTPPQTYLRHVSAWSGGSRLLKKPARHEATITAPNPNRAGMPRRATPFPIYFVQKTPPHCTERQPSQTNSPFDYPKRHARTFHEKVAYDDERRRDPEVDQPQQHGVDSFKWSLARFHLFATPAAFSPGAKEKRRRERDTFGQPNMVAGANVVGSSHKGQSTQFSLARRNVFVGGDHDVHAPRREDRFTKASKHFEEVQQHPSLGLKFASQNPTNTETT